MYCISSISIFVCLSWLKQIVFFHLLWDQNSHSGRPVRVCSRRRSPEWGSSRRSACRIPDMPAWTDKPSKLRSTTPPRRCNVSSSWRACTKTFPLRFELNSLSSSNLTQSDLRCLLAGDSSHGSFDSRVFFFQCYLFCKKKKKGG